MVCKTELHSHTRDVSPCSDQSAEFLAEKYIRAGYTSLTVTNHLAPYTLNHFFRDMPFEKQIDAYFDAVEKVRVAAGDKLFVLDGAEANIDDGDCLVYGLGREFFKSVPDMFSMNLWEFRNAVKSAGGLAIKAHPTRIGERLRSPEEVDGFEIFNGHIGNPSHNDVAEAWVKHFASDYKMICTSGTDNHDEYQEPDAGILTDRPIKTPAELVEVLKSGEYELITCDMEKYEH